MSNFLGLLSYGSWPLHHPWWSAAIAIFLLAAVGAVLNWPMTLAWIKRAWCFGLSHAPAIALGVLFAAILVQRHTIVVERTINREFRQLATDASGADKLLSAADARTAFTRVAGERAALQTTVANVRTATAKAHADDLAHARAVEAAQTQITKETTNALTRQLADARAAADRHVGLYFDPALGADRAGAGGSGGAGVPAPAGTPGGAAGTGQAAVMANDERACGEAVIKAQGWLDWFTAVAALPR